MRARQRGIAPTRRSRASGGAFCKQVTGECLASRPKPPVRARQRGRCADPYGPRRQREARLSERNWSVYELTDRAPGLEAGRGVEKHSNGMPPNLLAHYFYLWEPTVVWQAIETVWTSASVRRTFVELLVPVG